MKTSLGLAGVALCALTGCVVAPPPLAMQPQQVPLIAAPGPGKTEAGFGADDVACRAEAGRAPRPYAAATRPGVPPGTVEAPPAPDTLPPGVVYLRCMEARGNQVEPMPTAAPPPYYGSYAPYPIYAAYGPSGFYGYDPFFGPAFGYGYGFGLGAFGGYYGGGYYGRFGYGRFGYGGYGGYGRFGGGWGGWGGYRGGGGGWGGYRGGGGYGGGYGGGGGQNIGIGGGGFHGGGGGGGGGWGRR